MSEVTSRYEQALSIDALDFEFFTDFLKKTSGYHLTAEKKYLLEARLGDVLKHHGFRDIKSLIQALRTDIGGKLSEGVVEAMTVNETFFFRDKSPFETIEQKILPKLAEKKENKPFRIWSAACSTGQEPYSLALIIEENRFKYPNITYEIIATDINRRVLEQAKKGMFTELEVNRGLPEQYRDKYFSKEGSRWALSEKVRNHIQFQYLNLNESYNVPGMFDLVLLRNVLIYFNEADKEKILRNVSYKMHRDAYLLLGAAEGIYDPEHYFQRCNEIKGLYRFKG